MTKLVYHATLYVVMCNQTLYQPLH